MAATFSLEEAYTAPPAAAAPSSGSFSLSEAYGTAPASPPAFASVHRGFSRFRQGLAGVGADLGITSPESAGETIAEQERYQQSIPAPPETVAAMRQMSEAQSIPDFLNGLIRSPGALFSIMGESLGQGGPGMLASIPGAVGGPVGFGAAAGITSGATEYASSVLDSLKEAGIRLDDPKAVAQGLSSPETMAKAREHAVKRGVPVGLFDGLTAGFAGKIMRMAGGPQSVSGFVGRGAGEAGMQAAGGASGEASAQLASEGKISRPGEVALEAIAEIPTGVVETAIGARNAPRAAPVQPPQEQGPPVPPLALPAPSTSYGPGFTARPQAPGDGQTIDPAEALRQQAAARRADGPPVESAPPQGAPLALPMPDPRDEQGNLRGDTFSMAPAEPEPSVPPPPLDALPAPQQRTVAPPGLSQTATAGDPRFTVSPPPLDTSPAPQAPVDGLIGQERRRALPAPTLAPETRAFHAVAQLQPGQPVTNRYVMQAAGKGADLDKVKQSLADRGLIKQKGKAWVRAANPQAPVTPEPAAQAPAAGQALPQTAAPPIQSAEKWSAPVANQSAAPADQPLAPDVSRETSNAVSAEPDEPTIHLTERRPRATGPRNLLEFIADRGGIIDTGGELKAMDLHRSRRPGLKRLVVGSGRDEQDALDMSLGRHGRSEFDPDMVRAAAIEAGYLPEDATIDDLYTAMDQTMRGEPVYAQGDMGEIQAREDAAEAKDARRQERRSLEEAAEDYGIDPGRLSDKTIRARIAEAEAKVERAERLAIKHADRARKEADGAGEEFDIPWGDENAPRGSSAEAPADPVDAQEPAVERDANRVEGSPAGEPRSPDGGGRSLDQVDTADGPRDQTVIPGAERATREEVQSARRDAREERRAEEERIEGRQSKLRKGNQKSVNDQGGGLFEDAKKKDQKTLFQRDTSERRPSEPETPDTGETVSWQVAPDLKAEYVAKPEWTAKRSEAADALVEILRQMVPNKRVLLNLADWLTGGEGKDASGVLGAYTSRQGPTLESVISLAMQDTKTGERRSTRDLLKTLNHETLHFLRQTGLLTKPEWNVLVQAAKRQGWMENYDIASRYGEESEAAQIEEAIAEARAAYAVGDLKVQPGIRKIFDKVAQFLDRVRNWMTGNGFQTWRDVMEAIGTGEVGSRPETSSSPDADWSSTLKAERDTDISPEEMNKARGSLFQKQEKGSAKEEEILGRILGTTDKPFGQRAREFLSHWKANIGAEFRQGVFDQYDAIAAAEKSANDGKLMDASVSAYKRARMLNSGGVIRTLLNDGMVQWSDKAGTWVKRDGFEGGFNAIFEPLAKKGLLRLWQGWAIANRSKRLIQEGRESLLSQSDIDTLLALGEKHPEFKDVQAQWAKFNSATLDMAEQAGVISKEGRALWERSDYVPFFRIMEDESVPGPGGKKGLAGQRSGIKKLEGGKEQINDLMMNMVRNLSHLVDASMKNKAAQASVELGLKVGALENAGSPQALGDAEVARTLDRAGVDPANLSAEDRAGFRDILASRQPKTRGGFTVMFDGKPKAYIANDPFFLRSMTSIHWPGFQGFMWDLFGGAKQLLTRSVTVFPDFMLANAMRDSMASWVVTGGKTTPWGAAKGALDSLKDSASAKAIRASGADAVGFYNVDPEARARALKRMDEGKPGRNFLMSWWDKWEQVGKASDNANRLALYDRLIKDGATPAEAAYQAMDLMDFSMKGDAQALRLLTAVVPFMNARLQGMYKLGRAAAENPKAFAIRGGIITAASLALMAANMGDPDYEQIPDQEKDNYYHFKVGDRFFKFPKPFEIGAVFSTVPERLVRYAAGQDEGARTARRMLHVLTDNLAMDPTPQLVKPILEQAMNKVGFTSAPIETMAMKNVRPGDRSDNRTSALAKGLGSLAPDTISPARVDALLKGYLGTLGSYIMGASNTVGDVLTDSARPTQRIEDTAVIGRFFRQNPARSTQYMTDFYELQDKVGQVAGSIRARMKLGDTEGARELMKENPGAVELSRVADRMGDQISTIRSRIKVIQADTKMSGDEKRKQIDGLQERINGLAERAVKTLRQARETVRQSASR